MEQSKVNDMDATQLCREILRPYFAKGAYALNDGRYIIADADGCHRSTENRVRVPLMIETGTPVDAVMIDPENVANYCEAHGTDIDQLRKDLAAYYFIYYKTMLCALIKLRGRREAARWARDWRAQGNVFAPIAAAVLILRGKETNAEVRERLTHVYTKSLIMSKPAFIYNDMPVYLRKYAERAYIEEQASAVTRQCAPERLYIPTQEELRQGKRTNLHPMDVSAHNFFAQWYTNKDVPFLLEQESAIYEDLKAGICDEELERKVLRLYERTKERIFEANGKVRKRPDWNEFLRYIAAAYGVQMTYYAPSRLRRKD